MLRHLFIIGYDIASNRRRRKALKAVKGHAIGGQKSVHQCWLTSGDLQQAMATLRGLIEPSTDRVVFLRLDPRACSTAWCCAPSCVHSAACCKAH